MSTRQRGPVFSEYISDFCKAVDNALGDYGYCIHEMERLDKLTQDYLHMLELGDLKYAERAKLATKLQQCRQERREYKDVVQVLAPLFEHFSDARNKNSFNQLREVLGKMRKVERRQNHRVYYPRVLDTPIIIQKK